MDLTLPDFALPNLTLPGLALSDLAPSGLTLLDLIAVYPLTLLLSVWLLGALFAYTLKSTPYSAISPLTVNHVDPAIVYFKEKALVIGVELVFGAFKRFRAKMGKDSNIQYRENYCIVDVRDRGRHHSVYLPYRKKLRREARYKITAESEASQNEVMHTVPGVPILVSPKDLGKDVIKCSKPNGEVIWSFKGVERPLCHMIKADSRPGVGE